MGILISSRLGDSDRHIAATSPWLSPKRPDSPRQNSSRRFTALGGAARPMLFDRFAFKIPNYGSLNWPLKLTKNLSNECQLGLTSGAAVLLGANASTVGEELQKKEAAVCSAGQRLL